MHGSCTGGRRRILPYDPLSVVYFSSDIMSIFMKRNKWWIGFRGPDGKWHREAIGACHKLAEQVLAKRKAEVVEGRFFPDRASSSKSFTDIAEKYWDLHLKHTKSNSWRYMLERTKERFKGMKACQVRPEDVLTYYNEITTRATNATANRYRGPSRLS
mgnify:CR=1 FL=1